MPEYHRCVLTNKDNLMFLMNILCIFSPMVFNVIMYLWIIKILIKKMSNAKNILRITGKGVFALLVFKKSHLLEYYIIDRDRYIVVVLEVPFVFWVF